MRCVVCEKKVSFTIGCRCGKILCNSHRLPIDHKCSVDVNILHMKEIEKNNPKITKEKITKI